MEWSIFLTLVICITVANAKPSGTSKHNSTEDENSTRDSFSWIHTLVKKKPSSTTKQILNENEIRINKLREDAFNLAFFRINSMVRELAQKSFQNSKPNLEQRFQKRFPTCERAVIDAMLNDVSRRIQETDPYPCHDAVDPIEKTAMIILKDANEHLEYFKSQKNGTVNDDEKNAKLEEIRRMENQISDYKKSNFESETLGLNNCFKNFLNGIMDQWDDIVVPEDECKTSKDYNVLFVNNDVASA